MGDNHKHHHSVADLAAQLQRSMPPPSVSTNRKPLRFVQPTAVDVGPNCGRCRPPPRAIGTKIGAVACLISVLLRFGRVAVKKDTTASWRTAQIAVLPTFGCERCLFFAFTTGKDSREIAYNGEVSEEGALGSRTQVGNDQAATDDESEGKYDCRS